MLNQDQVLLVFGSVNANPADRNLKRSEVSTLQYIGPDLKLRMTDLFKGWGTLGLSAMTLIPGSESRFFITTGSTVLFVDLLADNPVQPLKIPKLRGVHEISIIKERLWITNTYYDEVIAYDYQKQRLVKRLKLTPRKVSELDEQNIDPDDEVRINKFHCNQVFENYNGQICLLVHHVTGEQVMRRIAQKLVKTQGDGGVLGVDSEKLYRLGLKAPHSVRLIEGNYWVFDSGHFELAVFDKSWGLLNRINLSGWGRGGCYSAYSNTFFAGISSPRRRYLKFLEGSSKKNQIRAVDSRKMEIVRSWDIEGIEQVNNLYLVKRSFLESLESIKLVLNNYAPE